MSLPPIPGRKPVHLWLTRVHPLIRFYGAALAVLAAAELLGYPKSFEQSVVISVVAVFVGASCYLLIADAASARDRSTRWQFLRHSVRRER